MGLSLDSCVFSLLPAEPHTRSVPQFPLSRRQHSPRGSDPGVLGLFSICPGTQGRLGVPCWILQPRCLHPAAGGDGAMPVSRISHRLFPPWASPRRGAEGEGRCCGPWLHPWWGAPASAPQPWGGWWGGIWTTPHPRFGLEHLQAPGFSDQQVEMYNNSLPNWERTPGFCSFNAQTGNVHPAFAHLTAPHPGRADGVRAAEHP